MAQYDVQVQRRRQLRTKRMPNSERPNQVPQDMMTPELKQLKPKNLRKHGVVGLDRKLPGLPNLEKIISHFRLRRMKQNDLSLHTSEDKQTAGTGN